MGIMEPPRCVVMHCAVWWQAVFGPGDDYQVVPDLTMVEALEECADGLRITGQRECVFVCVSIDVVVSGSQVRGSAFLFVFPLMPWSQDHRSEGVRFCLCFPWCHGLRITGQRECVFVCVSIDAMVSGSLVRGSVFLCSHWCRGLRIADQRECVFVFVPIDVVSESQVRGSVFLFVFPLMPWSQNHRSEGVRFCLCFHWCHGLGITGQRDCIFVCVSIDAMVSESQNTEYFIHPITGNYSVTSHIKST